MLVGVPLLDEVVDDYEDAATRLPGYPARLFEAIGPVDGQVVIEGGAGAGTSPPNPPTSVGPSWSTSRHQYAAPAAAG